MPLRVFIPFLALLTIGGTQLTLEYRWVGEHTAGPTHVAQSAAAGEEFVVSDSVVLDLGGVVRAQVAPEGSRGRGWDVIVRLTPAATAAFSEATAAHVGQQLAVLLDGRVVQVARVDSRLGGVAGVLSGVSRETADSVAARINETRVPCDRKSAAR